MRYLPNGTWMQKADEDTIQRIGIPPLVLMERAALKTVEVMKERQIALEQCLVVCGSGNNGGDGFAVARLLHMEGKRVCAVFVGSEASMSEECRMQREIAGNLGVQIVTDIPREEYTVVIDAVFGVGPVSYTHLDVYKRQEMIYLCKASDMDALYYGELDIEYGENIAEFPEEMELIWQS